MFFGPFKNPTPDFKRDSERGFTFQPIDQQSDRRDKTGALGTNQHAKRTDRHKIQLHFDIANCTIVHEYVARSNLDRQRERFRFAAVKLVK